ncbi:MAG: uroporphyrinogen decarboxylase family protein [Armatimonadota bacterium]
MTNAAAKIQRLRDALSHRQPDRIPVGEAFWTGHLKRCRELWGEDFDPYRAYDLDYIMIMPNLDPRIQEFEIVSQHGEDIVVRTGFGATIRRSGDLPMPHFDSFSVNHPDEMADFAFDAPDDPRRFFKAGDDQLNCVGDALSRNIPSWDDRLKPYQDDFAIFGGACEPYEYLWRIIGSENALLWMGLHPDKLSAFIDRIGEWMLSALKAQIAAGAGRLSGMYLYGDVAYRNAMLFSPATWRQMFAPHVKALIDACHEHNLMVVYHGCGRATDIFDDLVAMGLDAYNPLEVKAGLDVVELKKQFGSRLAFVGNIDVRILERGDPDEIRAEVRYKAQAAKGGGWVFQSDHSISSDVWPESYRLAIETLREIR